MSLSFVGGGGLYCFQIYLLRPIYLIDWHDFDHLMMIFLFNFTASLLVTILLIDLLCLEILVDLWVVENLLDNLFFFFFHLNYRRDDGHFVTFLNALLICELIVFDLLQFL